MKYNLRFFLLNFKIVALAIFIIFNILFYISPVSSRQKITMILVPLESPSVMYKNFLPLKRYLEEKLDISIRIRVAKEPIDIIKHLERGEADIAFVCPTIYCETYEKVSITPIVKLRVNGSSEERGVIVVRNDSPVKKLSDLLDRSFAYGRYKCPGSGLLPKIMLQRIGISDGDFLEVVRLGSDESSLTAVMARMFDATAASEITAKPYLNSGLRVLRYSYPIPQYLFVARDSIGKQLILKLKEVMLSLNNHVDRRRILSGIGEGVDGFSVAKDSDYDLVRVLMSSVSEEKGTMFKQRGKIKFVVEPVYFGPDLFIRLNPLITYLERMTGEKFRLVIPEDTDKFLKMIEKGEGDFFFQSHHLYSEAARRGSVKGIAIARDGHDFNVGVIITHAVSNIKKVNDLAGKRIGITSRHSDSGYLSQRDLLVGKGVKIKETKFVELKTFENVIMKVYRGEVDAGFINLESLKSMDDDIDMSRIIIIAKTDPLPEWVLSVKKDMDPRLLGKVRKYLASFKDKRSPGGIGISSFNTFEGD